MKTLGAAAMSLVLVMSDACNSGTLAECWRDGRVAYVHGQETCVQLDANAFIASEHRSDDPLVRAALAVAREVVSSLSMDDESSHILGEGVVEDFAGRGMHGLVSVAVDWSNLLGDNTFRLHFYSASGEPVLLYVDPVKREHEWALPLE